MYKIKMTCFEPNGTHFEDEPLANGPWETRADAYAAAYELAEDEAEWMNDGADEGISFGVVEDNGKICVLYYYNEEYDDTGNTELVTVYYIEEVK